MSIALCFAPTTQRCLFNENGTEINASKMFGFVRQDNILAHGSKILGDFKSHKKRIYVSEMSL